LQHLFPPKDKSEDKSLSLYISSQACTPGDLYVDCIVLSNASLSTLLRAQEAFQNVAETTDLKSEYQVQAEINKIRYNKD